MKRLTAELPLFRSSVIPRAHIGKTLQQSSSDEAARRLAAALADLKKREQE
jgi:hypothetical protein